MNLEMSFREWRVPMQPYEYEGGRRLGNYAQSGERLAMDLGIPNPYSIM